jgi:PAS domain S-box-containing protein
MITEDETRLFSEEMPSGQNVAPAGECGFFRQLARHIPSLIWCFDLNFQLIYINAAVTACLGYSRRDAYLLKADQLLTPSSFQHALDILQQEWAKEARGEPTLPYVIMELEHLRRDGSRVWMEVEATFLPDDDGRPSGFMGLSRDITSRRRMLQTLEQKEAHLQLLVKESQILAKIGRIVSSSLDFADIYESLAQEVVKLIPCDRLSVTLRTAGEDYLASVYSWGMKIAERERNEPFPLKGTLGEKIMATGQSLYIPEVTPDLADRFPGSIYVSHPEIKAVLGVPLMAKSRVFGVLFFTFLKPAPLNPRELRVAEQVADQIAGALAMAHLFKEHERLLLEGKIMEERLRQAHKMEAIGTLAGGIAHDFNNILSAVIGYAELASWELPEGSRAKRNLQRVVEAAFRGRDLSRQILTFSRKTASERQPLDLASIVKDAIKLLRASIPSSIEIQTLVEGENHTVMADATQMHQVLMNLVTNAAQAVESPGGLIAVTLAAEPVPRDRPFLFGSLEGSSCVRLQVADNGCGMTPEVLSRIFEPYFTTRGGEQGTGLGLAVVLGIVNDSGGALNVASKPGQGSIFDLYFPAAGTAEAVSPEAARKETPVLLSRGQGEAILYVDDEEAIVAAARELLTNLGYRVRAFSDSREALMAFQADPPAWDLVITDLTMPGLSGYDLAAAIKRTRPRLAVLLCTGYHDAVNAASQEKASVDEVLLKPLSLEKLAAVVREILDRRPGRS